MYEGCTKQEKSLKLGDFSVFSCIYQKLLLILQPNLRRSRFYAAEGGGFFTY